MTTRGKPPMKRFTDAAWGSQLCEWGLETSRNGYRRFSPTKAVGTCSVTRTHPLFDATIEEAQKALPKLDLHDVGEKNGRFWIVFRLDDDMPMRLQVMAARTAIDALENVPE
jgi:hypothetical protein